MSVKDYFSVAVAVQNESGSCGVSFKLTYS